MSNPHDDKSNKQSSENGALKDSSMITDHYQALPKLSANESIDAAILLKAKKQASNYALPEVPLWRKWQYGGAVAASVMVVVTVLIATNVQLSIEKNQSYESASAEQAPMSDEASLDELVLNGNTMDSRGAEIIAQTPEQIVVSAARVANNHALNDANTLPVRANTMTSAVQLSEKEAAKVSSEQKKQTRKQHAVLLARLKQMQSTPDNFADANKPLSAFNKESDEVVQKIELSQQSKSFEAEYQRLQTELFKLLMEDKRNDKNGSIDEEYLEVLLPEQITILKGEKEY